MDHQIPWNWFHGKSERQEISEISTVWYVVLFLVQHSLEIFISLIFYVKSILENLEVQQNAILAISGALKSHQIKCSVFRNAKMADFECLDLPTLISRKIWVTEKVCNFQTVPRWFFSTIPTLMENMINFFRNFVVKPI